MTIARLLAPALLTAALSGCATLPGGEPVALDRLRAEPDAYAGRVVRVRGTMDECQVMSCHICPEGRTPGSTSKAGCLAVAFARPADGPLHRHATITLDARFDPACLQQLCLDRASVLLDARVARVHRRAEGGAGRAS